MKREQHFRVKKFFHLLRFVWSKDDQTTTTVRRADLQTSPHTFSKRGQKTKLRRKKERILVLLVVRRGEVTFTRERSALWNQ